MYTDINQILSGSLHLVQNLLDLLDEDEAEMPSCVTGELLDEYRKTTAVARDKIVQVKQRLIRLQEAEAQRNGM